MQFLMECIQKCLLRFLREAMPRFVKILLGISRGDPSGIHAGDLQFLKKFVFQSSSFGNSPKIFLDKSFSSFSGNFSRTFPGSLYGNSSGMFFQQFFFRYTPGVPWCFPQVDISKVFQQFLLKLLLKEKKLLVPQVLFCQFLQGVL